MHADIQLQNAPSPRAPAKLVECQRRDTAGERRVQQTLWPQAGQTRVTTEQGIVFELFLDLTGTNDPQAAYECEIQRHGRCSVGAVNFLPPHTDLQLHWTAGRKRSFVCMLDPRKLGALGGLAWDWSDIDPLAALDIRNERLRAALHWLADETLQPSFASELRTHSLLTMLALEARQHLGRHPDETLAVCDGKLSPRQLTRTQELIHACNEPEGPSLAALAQACDLPAREFSEMFKNTVGTTLRSYVAQAHLDKARLLLADPRLLIKQVAYRSGFESASAFGAAFRKATGLTPAQYRQQVCAQAHEPAPACA